MRFTASVSECGSFIHALYILCTCIWSCVLMYGSVRYEFFVTQVTIVVHTRRVSREMFICYFAYSLLKASYCVNSWTILSYVFRYKCSNWLVDIWFSRKYCVCHPSDSRFIVSFSCSIKCSILVKINMIIFIRPVYLLRFLFSPCRYHLLHCIPSFYSCCPESIVKL